MFDALTKRILPPQVSQDAKQKMGESIRRYTHAEMASVWEEKNKFINWVLIEKALCEFYFETGLIDDLQWKNLKSAFEKIVLKGGIDIQAMDRRELLTKHDVNAFVDQLIDELKIFGAGESARWVHVGLTSTDVVDTGNSILIHQASFLILRSVDLILETLKKLALEHKHTRTIARTHGQHAELTTYGVRFLHAYSEISFARKNLHAALNDMGGKLSGPVGTYSHIRPKDETQILAKLGLEPISIGTQVVSRTRHSLWMHALLGLGQSIAKFSSDLRLLCFSEVDEIGVEFTKGQKGSSAMPHKKNPIVEEQILGLFRLLQGYSLTSDLNTLLEFERDISHSCNERVAFSHASLVSFHMLKVFQTEIVSLKIKTEKIEKKLTDLSDFPFSGHYLIALIQMGLDREEAYQAIQKAAHVFREGGQSLKKTLGENFGEKFLNALAAEQPQGGCLASAEYQFRFVNELYDRVILPGGG